MYTVSKDAQKRSLPNRSGTDGVYHTKQLAFFSETMLHAKCISLNRLLSATPRWLHHKVSQGQKLRESQVYFSRLLPSPVLFTEGTSKKGGHYIDLFSCVFFLFLVLTLKKKTRLWKICVRKIWCSAPTCWRSRQTMRREELVLKRWLVSGREGSWCC